MTHLIRLTQIAFLASMFLAISCIVRAQTPSPMPTPKASPLPSAPSTDVSAATPEPPRDLLPGQTIEREMTGAETHRYKFELKANEFFQVRVEQKGVDVVLKLRDAAGQVHAMMDSPNGKDGPETITYISDRSGDFVLEIVGLGADPTKGIYSIYREEPRAATAKDRRRVEVENSFAQGITAAGVKGQEGIALKRLLEAQTGWTELADDYLEKLTEQTEQVVIAVLNNDVQTAARLLKEGQVLSTKSKADALVARAKLQEVLKMVQALDGKIRESALIGETRSPRAASQQTIEKVNGFQFYSKLYAGLSLNAIAQTYHNLGENDQWANYLKLAVVAYDETLKLLPTSQISMLDQKRMLTALRSNDVSTLMNLGGALNNLGKSEEALAYLNQALEQVRALSQEAAESRFKIDEAMIDAQMALIYVNESRRRKTGIEFLLKAIEIYRMFPDERSALAILLDQVGGQYLLDLDYEAASKNWDEAFEIYRELDNKAGQANALSGKGLLYYITGNKPKVREIFHQYLLVLESPGYPESFKKSLSLNPDGGFDVFGELADDIVEKTRLDRVGFAYELLEDYGKSIEYYQKALVIQQSQNNIDGIRSEFSSIASIYIKWEKWEKAYQYALKALAISRNSNNKEEMAGDSSDVGLALVESGRPNEALEYQNEALTLYQSSGVGARKANSLRYDRALSEIARTEFALGNRQLAIFFGKQAVNAIQDERQRLQNLDPISQKGFIERKQADYRRLADWLIADGRIIEAEQVLGMLKEEEVISYLRRDPTEADKLQRRADLTPDEADALKRYNELAGKITTLGAESEKLKALQSQGITLDDAQQQRYAELTKQIDDANYSFSAFLKQLAEEFGKRGTTAVGLNETFAVQSKLAGWGDGVVFLYTLVGDDRYRVILITPGAKADGKHEIKSTDLNQKIMDFRHIVQNPKLDPRPLGKELYNILIKPIEKELEGARAKTLLWSLDGNLRLLPLAALWDGKQYFGQKYQNVTITVASHDNLSDAPSANWRALGLGVTQAKSMNVTDAAGGTHDVKFAALPGVTAELNAIIQNPQSPQAVLPGQILLDSAFNETELGKQLLRGYKVIHIASHFSLNAGDSTKSFLLLGDGQALTVDRIKNSSQLSFSGVDLLTLSACDTAVVETDSNGKEMEGFGYVAQQKGAKAILATLWPVADCSTSLLMAEFYRLRQTQPGVTKAAAMQLAQAEMREGKLQPSRGACAPRSTDDLTAPEPGAISAPVFVTDPQKPYAHPYYWSPFVLIGNWR